MFKLKAVGLFCALSLLSTVLFADTTIKTFSGSGGKNTRPFQVAAGWEIQWDAKGDIFQLYLHTADGSLSGIPANQQGSGKGSSYQAKGGNYYLQVNAIGRWEINIVQTNGTSLKKSKLDVNNNGIINASNKVNPSDKVADSLIQTPVSKLDFGMYRIEMHLNDYFKRINPEGKFDIFPSAFNVFYSQEKSKIIINAMDFPSEASSYNNEVTRKLMELGFNQIREALAIRKDKSLPRGDEPTFLTKFFYPYLWDKPKQPGWQQLQKKIYELIEINFKVIFIRDDGSTKTLRSYGPLLGSKVSFSN